VATLLPFARRHVSYERLYLCPYSSSPLLVYGFRGEYIHHCIFHLTTTIGHDRGSHVMQSRRAGQLQSHY
jgi:hypothetical protein